MKLTPSRRFHFRNVSTVAVCLLFSPAAFAAGMPFIEINPASRTAFRQRGTGEPFVMVGLNYFDHETGWAPKLWHKFDEDRVRQQLTLVHDLGLNTIRVFLTQDSFHRQPGQVNPEGEAKFRKLLSICRELGIYVIPSGPDHWEGTPDWHKGDVFADETILEADAAWWAEFAGRFKDEPAILAWDLLNEPMVRWESPAMKTKWNNWLEVEYGQVDEIAAAWERTAEEVGQLGSIEIPPDTPAPSDRRLFDYQRFREHIGDEWTRRHASAIRSADKNHLVTIGHIQWAVPIFLPAAKHHAGFDIRENARHLDFVTIHFYPMSSPRPCDGPEGMAVNASYLEAVLYLATTDKPLVLGEFGWYGGGELRVKDKVQLPAQPQEHQDQWCREVLKVSQGRLAGWLNWAMADTPTSTDLTRWSGCWTQQLELKPWGKTYREFARRVAERPDPPRAFPEYLTTFNFDRKAMITSPETGNQYRMKLNSARQEQE